VDIFNEPVPFIYRCKGRHTIFFRLIEFSCISRPFLAIYLQIIVPAFVFFALFILSIHIVAVLVLDPVVEVSVSDVSVEVSVRSAEFEAEPSALMPADLATVLAK
jgi:hypothetical protein